jgi:hypothetical protein
MARAPGDAQQLPSFVALSWRRAKTGTIRYTAPHTHTHTHTHTAHTRTQPRHGACDGNDYN